MMESVSGGKPSGILSAIGTEKTLAQRSLSTPIHLSLSAPKNRLISFYHTADSINGNDAFGLRL